MLIPEKSETTAAKKMENLHEYFIPPQEISLAKTVKSQK